MEWYVLCAVCGYGGRLHACVLFAENLICVCELLEDTLLAAQKKKKKKTDRNDYLQ